ncbi:hypothetical protein HY546_02325 [archaeon]|nr:hypothetical protein [archaeon]
MTGTETINLVLTALGTLIAALTAMYAVEKKYGFVIRLLNRLFFDRIDDVAVDKWNEKVSIDPDGNAHVTTEVMGHVNFGILHEKEIETVSTHATTLKKMKFHAQNLDTMDEIEPKLILDADRYKRIGLELGTLERRDKFHIKYEYTLQNNYAWVGKACYLYRAFHNERKISIVLEFPTNVSVTKSSVNGEEKTCGGVIKQMLGDCKPKPIGDKNTTIVVKIKNVKKGSTYRISWNAIPKVINTHKS